MLLQTAPKCGAEGLCGAPKHEKAVMCLTQKTCGSDRLPLGPELQCFVGGQG